MRRTRRDPPTILELEIDAARQARLQNNVERLALEYKEEKERLRLEEGSLRSEGVGARQLAAGEEQQDASAAEVKEEKPHLGDELLAAKTKRLQEEEREAAKRRREEFGECSARLPFLLSSSLTLHLFPSSSARSQGQSYVWGQGKPERHLRTRELESRSGCAEAEEGQVVWLRILETPSTLSGTLESQQRASGTRWEELGDGFNGAERSSALLQLVGHLPCTILLRSNVQWSPLPPSALTNSIPATCPGNCVSWL